MNLEGTESRTEAVGVGGHSNCEQGSPILNLSQRIYIVAKNVNFERQVKFSDSQSSIPKISKLTENPKQWNFQKF